MTAVTAYLDAPAGDGPELARVVPRAPGGGQADRLHLVTQVDGPGEGEDGEVPAHVDVGHHEVRVQHDPGDGDKLELSVRPAVVAQGHAEGARGLHVVLLYIHMFTLYILYTCSLTSTCHELTWTMSYTQWAAVRTWLLVRRLPPHMRLLAV